MFSTGYRELIVNKDESIFTVDSVSGDPGGNALWLNIGVLGNFVQADITGSKVDSSPAVAGVYSTVNAPSIGQASGSFYIMKVYTGYAGKVLAELFPERQTYQYQVVADDTYLSYGEAAAASMFGWPEDSLQLLLTDNAGEVTFTFGKGYEGANIVKITAQHFNVNGDPIGGVVNINFTEDVAPSEGFGIGSLIESSVRVYTDENREYQLNEFGHDLVDIQGTYTTYEFNVAPDADAEGWKEHEDTGHDIINELVVSKDTIYIIYINDNAPAAIALMDAFIA